MKIAIRLKKIWTNVSYQVWKYWMWLVLILILIGFLVLTAFVDSKSAIGMIGVTVGALISEFFSYFINETNYKKQLRLAALDKRLEAHQQAYTLWCEIKSSISNQEEINDVVQNARIWWQKNCLFLGPKSRAAFFNCLQYTGYYITMSNTSSIRNNKKEIRESWNTIMLPGRTLVEEVNLPSFGEEEYIKSEMEKKQ